MRDGLGPVALLLAFTGWVNRHQAEVIEYLLEENRVLKEQMAGRALQLNDDQRRRLAAKAKVLDKTLERVATIVRSSRPTPCFAGTDSSSL